MLIIKWKMWTDLGSDSLTHVALPEESMSDTARDNLEAGVWNVVTCLNQHIHTVP